jgi:hypothetical protein
MCWCTPNLRTPHCGKPTCVPPAVQTLVPVRINSQLYTRPVIRVAVVTVDGTSCIVPVGELLAVIEDGGPYTVEIKTMPVREFEAMPEFQGW